MTRTVDSTLIHSWIVYKQKKIKKNTGIQNELNIQNELYIYRFLEIPQDYKIHSVWCIQFCNVKTFNPYGKSTY